MEEAAQARRVIALNQGKIGLDGTPQEVFSSQARLEEIGLSVPPAAALADRLRPALPTLPQALLTGDALLSGLPPYPTPRSSTAMGIANQGNPGRPGLDRGC